MRTLFIILLVVVLQVMVSLTNLFSREFPLPEGVKFAFPKELSIKVEWLIPAEASPLMTGKKINFDLDSRGEPWLGLEGKYLYSPLKRKIFQINAAFQDFIFLSDREFLLATKDGLGVLTYHQGDAKLTFIPLLSLPPGEVRLRRGEKESLFILVFNPEKELSQVFQLRATGDGGEALKVLEMGGKIQDFCVAKDNLYLAINRLVVKLNLTTKKMEPLFRHSNPLKGIECLGVDQLVYATYDSLGFVGKQNRVEFARVKNPQIRIINQDLYALFEDTLGVVKISEIGKLDKPYFLTKKNFFQ